LFTATNELFNAMISYGDRNIHSFSNPSFFQGRPARAVTQGGLEIPHGFQQPLVVQLAPHLDRTRPDWRCNHPA